MRGWDRSAPGAEQIQRMGPTSLSARRPGADTERGFFAIGEGGKQGRALGTCPGRHGVGRAPAPRARSGAGPAVRPRPSLLDRGTDHAAVLRPAAVIVA